MKFEAITFLPDGGIWDNNKYITNEQDRDLIEAFGPCVTFDNKRQKSEIETVIGALKLDWNGSDQFGVGSSTWWLDDKIINTSVCLYGINEEELNILNNFLKTWRETHFVKELCKGKTPFTEVYEIKERPLMISVNWSVIKPEQYSKVENFDLCLASVFFEGMQSIEKIS